MGLDYILVERQAEAGAVRQTEIPIHDFRTTACTLARVRLGEVVEVLLNLEVSAGGGEVQRGRRRDRAADVVRGDRDIIHVGHRRDLLCFQEAAAFGDVWLNDVAGLPLE